MITVCSSLKGDYQGRVMIKWIERFNTDELEITEARTEESAAEGILDLSVQYLCHTGYSRFQYG